MTHYPYLIVGGGMAAHAAAAAIRELDASTPIGMIAEEPHRPYARPPLSKALWTGKPEESVWLAAVPGLEILTGSRATALDPIQKHVGLATGETHSYGKLLLATGGRPRRLGAGDEEVVYFRTLDDYRRLRALRGERVVVVGGGFIGSEIAAALAQDGKKVTLVFPEPAVCARALPATLAAYVTRVYQEKGVEVVSGARVSHLVRRGGGLSVVTAGGRELVGDAVVAGLGIVPETALAEGAGIATHDGIAVDAELRTSARDVFAAGDVARFPSAVLGESVRVEHEDNALTMGRTAGRAMAGVVEPYRHVPFFYSDLFDLGYEAVGQLDPRLETVAAWRTPNREGIVYYLAGDRVRGVLLWGIFGQVDAARALLARPVRRDELRASLAS